MLGRSFRFDNAGIVTVDVDEPALDDQHAGRQSARRSCQSVASSGRSGTSTCTVKCEHGVSAEGVVVAPRPRPRPTRPYARSNVMAGRTSSERQSVKPTRHITRTRARVSAPPYVRRRDSPTPARDRTEDEGRVELNLSRREEKVIELQPVFGPAGERQTARQPSPAVQLLASGTAEAQSPCRLRPTTEVSRRRRGHSL